MMKVFGALVLVLIALATPAFNQVNDDDEYFIEETVLDDDEVCIVSKVDISTLICTAIPVG